MTSARPAVLYVFAALATLAILALSAPASERSRVPADSVGCYQHIQNASFPLIAGHRTAQRVAAKKFASATGIPQMGVTFDPLMSKQNFAGPERRWVSARQARGGTC
jgi:hypothetical protein